jgi:hypothetical protein
VIAQFNLSMRMSRYFLDRREVQKRLGKANARAMSKVGAFLRRRARSSLRRRKRTSRPGEPPSVHSDDAVANLKNILFAVEPRRQSLVVGPVALNQVNQSWIDLAGRTVPQVMEFGDVLVLREWRFAQLDAKQKWSGWDRYTSTAKFGTEWRRQDRRWRDAARKRRGHRLSDLGVQTRQRRAIYRPRPFMGPALQQEVDAGTIPSAWIGAVEAA